jgi:hypothetical protein
MDEIKNDEEDDAMIKFYEKIGEFAKDNGVTVNIISIDGEECDLDALSKLAEATGGDVDKIEPTKLMDNFANMLSVPVIATNVTATIKVH